MLALYTIFVKHADFPDRVIVRRSLVRSGLIAMDREAMLCADIDAARRCIQQALPGATLLQPEGVEPLPIFEVWG